MAEPPNQQQQPLQHQEQLPPQQWPEQPPPDLSDIVKVSDIPIMQRQKKKAAPQIPGEVKTLFVDELLEWMDEDYLYSIFGETGELTGVEIVMNKQTQRPRYGLIEFTSSEIADRVLQTFNGTKMADSEQHFNLKWATRDVGKRRDEGSDYSIFVGNLAADVTDYVLRNTFNTRYPSVLSARVVTDRYSGLSKGYGFVRFGVESEQKQAIREMHGQLCSTKHMRVQLATKKPAGGQGASSLNSEGAQVETDPSNTTIYVSGLDGSVTKKQLGQAFCQYGELVYVDIPDGKRCAFVQFSERASAEKALSKLHGSELGGQFIRLCWARVPSNKQSQPDRSRLNAAQYYGYSQGYEAHGYAPRSQ